MKNRKKKRYEEIQYWKRMFVLKNLCYSRSNLQYVSLYVVHITCIFVGIIPLQFAFPMPSQTKIRRFTIFSFSQSHSNNTLQMAYSRIFWGNNIEITILIHPITMLTKLKEIGIVTKINCLHSSSFLITVRFKLPYDLSLYENKHYLSKIWTFWINF